MKKQILAILVAIVGCQTAFAQTFEAPNASKPNEIKAIAAVQPANKTAADGKIADNIESSATENLFDKQKIESAQSNRAEKDLPRFDSDNRAARKKSAQTVEDYYWKYEFFGGYSYSRTDTGFNRDDFANDDFDPSFNGIARTNFGAHGFHVSGVRNFNRFLGIKAEVSAHQRSGDILNVALPANLAGNQKYQLINFGAGLQIKDNLKETSRLKPFGQLLFGGGYQKFGFNQNLEQQFRDAGFRLSRTQFALAVGGGVDVRISRRVDFRLFQFDYVPLVETNPDQPEPLYEEDRIPGRTQNNFRFSIGIVFH